MKDTGEPDPTPTTQDDGLDLLEPSDIPQGMNPCREPELVELDYVVDGDTARFKTSRGSELVRFIGIDTAERGWDEEPDECFAIEATERVQELLAGGRAWLSFDEECEDHYDRTLGYLHVGVGSQDFVQRDLVRGGYATFFEVSPNTSFSSVFSEDESMASAAGSGLWGACAR